MDDISLFSIGTFFLISSRIGFEKIDHEMNFYLKGKIDSHGIYSIIYDTNDDQFDLFSWTSKGPMKRLIVDSTHEFYEPILDYTIQLRLER